MIEVDFYSEDRPRCDMCDQGAIIHITMKDSIFVDEIFFCENHLKELYQKIDPLRVLVMTGKDIRT
jgi:Holliday junction resolvasome RuvABC ATP-dependent DNA helicase subunit